MVTPAWASARLSYAGWVPNVGSHLSFSLIGSRAGKGVARLSARVKYPDRIARVVCALQKRTTDDMLLPPKLALRRKPDLQQHWFLVGETDSIDVPTGVESSAAKRRPLIRRLQKSPVVSDEPSDKITTARDEQGALIGRVMIIPYEEDEDGRDKQQGLIDFVYKRLSTAAHKREGKSSIVEVEKVLKEGVAGLLVVEFALMRTGEVRIWFDQESAQFDDEGHRQLARQAYFFIKDMSHRHVHHDHLDDQITPLIRFKNSTKKEKLESEVDWRRETLWSLSRMADKRMASEKLNYLREALGMLAYADAFQKSLLLHVRDPSNPLSYLPNKSAYGYDFQHIRESTRVRIDQTAARRTVTGQLIAAVFAGALASLALISSLVSTFNAKVGPDHLQEKLNVGIWKPLLKFLSDYPVAAMAASGYILFAAFALTLSDILFNRPRRRFQLIRGVSLSIAKRRNMNADQAFALLVSIYVGVTGAFIAAMTLMVIIVTWLPSDLGFSYFKAVVVAFFERLPIC